VKAEEGFTGELFRNESAVYNKVLARIAEDFSFYYLLFREGLVQTSKGYINKKGKLTIPGEYENLYPFNEGLAAVRKNGKWGYINKKGKVVIPFVYFYAGSFEDGLAVVRKNDKYGCINKKGKVVIPIKYKSDIRLYEISSRILYLSSHNVHPVKL
jgi:hypothetical protein